MMCLEGNPCTATWKNNLYYNTSNIGYDMNGGVLTEGNNTFLNSSFPANFYPSSTNVKISSGAPNPFVNWTGYDFHLASSNPYWENGAVLSSPFNVDAVGVSRPAPNGVWNRGAYQLSGSSQTPTPPTSLTTTAR